MKLENIVISGHSCHYHISDGLVFVWGIGQHERNSINSILTFLKTEHNIEDFSILMYEVDDWNRYLTPWPARTRIGSFSGEAATTLKWLEGALIPFIRKRTDQPLIHVGYSLSGLFSMWCMSQSSLFTGFISCSGSLWFPGWKEYMITAKAQTDCYVYMSFGLKESLIKDPDMCKVEENTLLQQLRLVSDKHVIDSYLRFEPGGHFNEPEKRIAHGIVWMLDKMQMNAEKELEHGEQAQRQGKKQ